MNKFKFLQKDFIRAKLSFLNARLKVIIYEQKFWKSVMVFYGLYGKYIETELPKVGSFIMGSAALFFALIHIFAEDTNTKIGKIAQAIDEAHSGE